MKKNKWIARLLTGVMLVTYLQTPLGTHTQVQAAESFDPAEDLILHVDFDKDDAGDLSGKEYDGIVKGPGVTFVDSDIGGRAVQIVNTMAVSGSQNDNVTGDSYIDFGKVISEQEMGSRDFTISFWYKSPDLNSYGALISNKDYYSGNYVGFAVGCFGANGNNSKMNFTVAPQGAANKSEFAGVDLGAIDWRQFVVTVQAGSVMTVYLDGVRVNSAALKTGTVHADFPLVLGAGGNGKNPMADVQFDELRVYDYALSADTVGAFFNSTALGARKTLGDLKARVEGTQESAIYPAEAIAAMKERVDEALEELEELDDPAELVALVLDVQSAYRNFVSGAKPIASFHLVSDVHIPSASDTTTEAVNYIAAMENMADINPDTTIAFVNAGDFTNNSTEAEYNGFYDLTDFYNPVTDEQTIIVMGNHDVRGPAGTDQVNWIRDPNEDPAKFVNWPGAKARYEAKNAPYMPQGTTTLYHSKELGGYTFIMLNTEVGLKDAMYLSTEQLDWVEETMKAAYENDPSKPIFIVGHNPLNDTHWLGNTLDGFDGILADGTPQPYQSGGDARLKEIMAKYPTGIYLSGHIHNEFGRAEAVMRPYGVVVDLPSFGQGGINSSEKGAGYEVQIYEDDIVFRAINYVTGQWYPQYDITILTPGYTAIYQRADAILNTGERDWYSKEGIRALEGAFQPLHAMLTRTYDQSALSWNSTNRAPQQFYQRADHEAIQAAALVMESVLENMVRLSEPRPVVTLDDLRESWRSYLLGGTGADLDLSNPAVQAYVDRLNTEAAGYWTLMVKSDDAGRDDLWTDLDMTPINDYSTAAYTRSGNMAATFTRLRTIATAWASIGTDFYRDGNVRDELIKALDYMMTSYFPYGTRGYGNWYHWEITAPTALMNTAIILYDELTPEQVETYAKHAKWYAPYCDRGGPNSNGPAMTAGNLLLKANGVAQAGILLGDTAMLDNVRTGVKKVLVHNPYSKLYASDADGFYADGSFIQHQALPYIGGYGSDLYNNLGVFLMTLNGSDWEISYDDHAEKVAYDFVFDGIEPFLYETRTMDMVSSRDVTRKTSTDRSRTARILSAIMPLRGTFPTQEQNVRFDGMMKYYLSLDPAYYYANMESITSVQMAAALLKDDSVTLRQGYTLTKTFAMDKTVHITDRFGFGISMHSSRTYGHEIINSEGKRTWNMSDGMFFLYDADEEQFGGGYWATVDPTRLPGITAEHIVFNNGTGDRTKNIYPWTGGASLDGYGAVGSHFRTLGQVNSSTRSGTDVKKSWFLFGERIVMVGSDITSTTGNGVETVVDNRKIRLDGSNTVTADGQVADLNGTPTTLSPTWMHLEGNVPGADIGYYFPAEQSVKAIKDTRTGDWSSQGTTSGEETNTYATFWFDHGASPTGAGYEYVLLPGKTAQETAAYAAAPDVEILRQDGHIHAAQDLKNGVITANFWDGSGGAVSGITVDGAASIVMKRTGEVVELAIAEPTQKDVTLTVSLATSGEVLSCDSNVTVVQIEPFVRLTVNTAGLGGGSSLVTLRTVPHEALELVSLVSAMPDALAVPSNTPFVELGLPGEAVFLANDMKEYTLPIVWTRNGYFPTEAGIFTVIGFPALGEAFLNSAALVIEVEVTQGVNEVFASHDNYVQDGTNSVNAVMGNGGTGTSFPVKLDDPGYHRKGFFQFDITAIPADSETVTFNVQVGMDAGFLGGELHVVEGAWTQDTITWNNRPQRVADSLAASFSLETPASNGVMILDVTAAVKAALAQGKTIISFEMAAIGNRNGGKNQMSVQSIESTTAVQRPALSWTVKVEAPAGDKRNLQFLKDTVDGLDPGEFINYRSAAFTAPMAEARRVLDDPDATVSQIGDAEDALMAFLLALRAVPVSTQPA